MNAIKLSLWVQFYRKARKQWFDIYLTVDAGETEDEIEDYITSKGLIYRLNEYADDRYHGAWDFRIKSFKKIEHDFQNDVEYNSNIIPI